MNGILINDTSGTSNPGCQGTVHCLVEGIRRQGVSVLSRVPVGYSHDLFRECFAAPPPPPRVHRLANRLRRACGFPGQSGSANPNRRICPSKWERAVATMHERLAPAWKSADLLLVNGEGTIHHNGVGALSLIGLCAAAKRMGKKVALVNCSIIEVDALLLETLRDSVDYLCVREPVTRRYLDVHGILSTLSADCLFLADPFTRAAGHPAIQTARPFVLYTPGVLTSGDRIDVETISNDITMLRSHGHAVVYFIVEAEDERFAATAAHAGATILPLGAVRWEQMPTLLERAGLVVSGRYHINIFAALAGVPFIPMETNTPKMQGVLELLSPDKPVKPVKVRRWGGKGCVADPLELDGAFTAGSEALSHCVELARNNFNLSGISV